MSRVQKLCLPKFLPQSAKVNAVYRRTPRRFIFLFLMIYLKSYDNASSDFDLKTFSVNCWSLSTYLTDWRNFYEVPPRVPSYKFVRFQEELFIETLIRYFFTFLNIFQNSRSNLTMKQKGILFTDDQLTRNFNIDMKTLKVPIKLQYCVI